MRRAPTKGLTLRVAWKSAYLTTGSQYEAAEYGYVMGLDALDRQTKRMVRKRKWAVVNAVTRRLEQDKRKMAPPPPAERMVVV